MIAEIQDDVSDYLTKGVLCQTPLLELLTKGLSSLESKGSELSLSSTSSSTCRLVVGTLRSYMEALYDGSGVCVAQVDLYEFPRRLLFALCRFISELPPTHSRLNACDLSRADKDRAKHLTHRSKHDSQSLFTVL